MQSSSDISLLEIIELAYSLRQEQLFVTNEQDNFIKLNTGLTKNSENVSQLAWICSQQRRNLNNLIVSKPDTGPSSCCRRANNLENTKFVAAHQAKGLKYPYVLAYTELFNYLYRMPYLLAQCLAIGDRVYRTNPDKMSSVVETIANGLYDNVIHSKDVEMVLKLLQELIEIQIVDSDNPRRMFRTGSCAFSRLYHRLHESLFSAKLFLTASLYDPIMKVLIEDEIMLDIDPAKTVANIPVKERIKRFGQVGTPEYEEKVRKYTEETIELLFNLTNRFVKSLSMNWSLFPSTLRWLVQSMCHFLKRTQFTDKDINSILTEMIFTNFICPAVVSPDLYGITDAPISENARFNLIQIGQILQMLALIRHEDVDPKLMEIYKKFDRNLIADLLTQLFPSERGGISMLAMSAQPNNNIGRKNVLITQTELNNFIDFLRGVLDNDGLTISGEDRRKLGDILKRLPDKWENILSENHQQQHSSMVDTTNKLLSKTQTNLINLQKKTKSKLAKTISLNVSSIESDDGPPHSINGNHHNGHNNNSNHNNNNPLCSQNNNHVNGNDFEQVLEIPITISDEPKFHLLTEEEVLNMNNISNDTVEPILTEKNVEQLERQTEENEGMNGVTLGRSNHQKHTRFSLSHDDASIGNTSDNLEAVSEAPSNHSVASSIDLEENFQNDNLSDMVSANVSGRGTPNISGRDTPSSQVTEGDNRPSQIPTPQMAKMLSKARSDIDDKFCKFEIKKLIEGDETVSIISDTWSTDVLASDSETIEASDRDRDRNFSTPLIPSAVILPGDNNFDPLSGTGSSHLRAHNLDVSETQSESAWSTDVLASDSEKMTEVDTDDNQSVAAKSDITDAGRSDGGGDNSRERLHQAPDSPMFFSPRVPNINFRTSSDSPLLYQGGNRSAGSSAERNAGIDEIVFFGGQNRNYVDYTSPVISMLRNSREQDTSTPTLLGGSANDDRRNSRERVSVGGNRGCFSDHHFMMGDGEYERQSYLTTPSTSKRQNSIESSNSEISSNFDHRDGEEKRKSFDYRKQTKDYVDSTPIVNEPFDEQNNNTSGQFQYDGLINSNGIIKSSTNLINPFEDLVTSAGASSLSSAAPLIQGLDGISDELVEHRRISSEHRNASFDGRRNGIIESTASSTAPNPASSNSNLLISSSVTTTKTRTNSNYENHEIIIRTSSTIVGASPRRSLTTMPSTSAATGLINANDDELILIKKTESLSLASITSAGGEQPTSSSAGRIVAPKNTGAIPKSISFDSSADKINRSNHHHHGHMAGGHHVKRSETTRVHSSGFFKKIKEGFKNRRGPKFRSLHDIDASSRDYSLATGRPVALHFPGEPYHHPSSSNSSGVMAVTASATPGVLDLLSTENNYGETTEDILAKYRRKASSSSDAAASDSTGSNASSSKSNKSSSDAIVEHQKHLLSNGGSDSCFLFNNAKRKLRIVLSSTDLQTSDFHHSCYSIASPLLIYLQIQLAQALNLQNLQQVSYVSETIRCVSTMDFHDHQKLLTELQQDLFKRQTYIQYLIRYRQNLLSALESLERFEYRLKNDREMCNRHLITVCVRMFLEKREVTIEKFIEKFTTLTVVDEKIDYLEECMQQLMDELRSDGILQGMADWQLQEARTCIERILLQRVYRQVMFPNDDGDMARDQVLREHIRKLSRRITPSHSNLRIPQEYLLEAPWPFAQQQISYISAYKTPKEKVQCVVRCITSIMNLLSMASHRVPSADDLTPVLIYVIIKANPPYLLSTIEYVNSFIGENLEGETQYWWTQFSSAVQYIKTMDYGE